MRARALFILAAAAAVAAVLLLPGEAAPSRLGTETVPGKAPLNLVSDTAAPAIHEAQAATALAERLVAAGGPSAALAELASPQARDLADARAPVPRSLEAEVLHLHARLGTTATPEELAAIQAADPGVARATAKLLAAIHVGADLRDEAFAALAPEERDALPAVVEAAVAAANDRHLSASERAAALAPLTALAAKVDHDKLAAAGLVVTRAVDEVRLDPPAGVEGAGGDVILSLVGGMVNVGGPGATSYTGFNILVLDLAGPDTYEDTAGGVPGFAPFPVSVVLDLEGDDTYHGTPASATTYARSNVQGSGTGGIGVLVDVMGQDRYSSAFPLSGVGADVSYTLSRAQGFGALGVGVLADLLGDDLYASAISLNAKDGSATYKVAQVQGAGLHGVGLLIDAGGVDAYNSHNSAAIDVENGKAFNTWTAQYCQGAVVAGGVGVQVEGALVNRLSYYSLRNLYVDADSLPGSDAYNSHNSISTILATTTAGFTGTTDGLAQMFNLNCQGSGDAAPAAPPSTIADAIAPGGAPGLPAGLALLVDLVGNDAFDSGNRITTAGINRGGVTDSCAACHLGADFTTRVSQGATGTTFYNDPDGSGGGDKGEAFPLPRAVAGVMVEVLGNDQYNSNNHMEVDGITFAARPGQTNGAATYLVSESLGHAGSYAFFFFPTLPTCEPGHGCPMPPCTVFLDMEGAGGSSPTCTVGVHVDLEGDDLYNSANFLQAANSDANWEDFVVERSLGAAERNGVGVHVDGPLGGYTWVTAGSSCPNPTICALIGSQGVFAGVVGGPSSTGSDTVNSWNTAARSMNFRLTDNLGAGNAGGLAVAVDVSPGAVVGVNAVLNLPKIGPLLTLGVFSGDLYDSYNTCGYGLEAARTLGYGDGMAGVFVEVGGSDTYVYNPGCLSTIYDLHGYASFAGGVGLFADVGGWDYYPPVSPPPGPLLFLPPGGPADETGWDYGTWLVRIPWGVDLLSPLT